VYRLIWRSPDSGQAAAAGDTTSAGSVTAGQSS
jgi:hypothetical protein